MSDSMLNLLQRMAANTSTSTIGWRNGAVVSSDDFIARVASWQTLLSPLSGQNFALYLEDSIEFAAALLGAWHAGKTIWLTADTLASSNNALKLSVDGFLGEFPADCAPLLLNAMPSTTPDSTAETALDYAALDAQFVGLVVHTSGTTGAAQAIPKKLSQLAIEVATLEQLFDARLADAEIISTVTHQHIYGLLFKVLWPLVSGRAIHARTVMFPEELAQLMSTRSCALISSPAHLKRLPMHLSWSGANSHLHAVFSSGGALPADVAQSSAALLGKMPIEIYGSSETGGIAWRQRRTEQDDVQDNSWQMLPNVEWRTSSDECLLEVRSPHLLSDAWHTLADRAQAHKNGGFILQGRADRIVKIEEKRISLDAIEQKLATSPLVAEVKVIVLSEQLNSNQRQHLAAVVVISELGKNLLLSAGKLAVNRQLKDLLVGIVEPVAIPRKWRYVDSFPINLQGKTPHAMLQALFENEAKAPEQAVLTPHYKIRHSDVNSVEFDVIWPPNLLYFSGHFPEAPVLPGVVQVDWAIKIGRQTFDLPTQFRAIHALKFQHVILPDSPVNLKLDFDQQKGCLSFSYFTSTWQHSSGRILFADAIHDDTQ
ncbi:AMP-binding protein [Solimicrobium silvestre]|uniref:AMP-binding enzyme n=1 Tax=Solimicrobium silvestre TaxID=2099400 RepID=A0A2S9H5K3_9BURK|nr:AMP-binding protein [Solimicrobium silvestre]PRC95156.1 AMP-binding enzyme [Solimicrobium silvestre]